MNIKVLVKLLVCIYFYSVITCDVYSISDTSLWLNIDHFWELLILLQAIKDK